MNSCRALPLKFVEHFRTACRKPRKMPARSSTVSTIPFWKSSARLLQAGFLDGLSQGYRTLADTLSDPAVQDAARGLGETLGSVIVTAAEALSFLIENADLAVTAIGGLVIARTVAGAVAHAQCSHYEQCGNGGGVAPGCQPVHGLCLAPGGDGSGHETGHRWP
jgi:hypothetical protein